MMPPVAWPGGGRPMRGYLPPHFLKNDQNFLKIGGNKRVPSLLPPRFWRIYMIYPLILPWPRPLGAIHGWGSRRRFRGGAPGARPLKLWHLRMAYVLMWYWQIRILPQNSMATVLRREMRPQLKFLDPPLGRSSGWRWEPWRCGL